MTVTKLDRNTYEVKFAGEILTVKTTVDGYIYYISETEDQDLLSPYLMVKMQNTIDMLHR